MTMPRDRTACSSPSFTGCSIAVAGSERFAAARLLLLIATLSAVAQPVFAQDEPVFQVPVLEDVDPNSVEFNDRIIERDRSQPGMGAPGGTPTAANQGAGSAGSSGGAAGSSGGGAGDYGRGAPTVFSGGPQLPSTGSGSGSGDGGIDVNVSVSGGPQMPTFSIPGLPGSEGSGGAGMPGGSMPGSSGTGSMPGMPGSSSGSDSGSGSASGNGDGSMAGTGSGAGSPGGMPGGMPGGSPDGVLGGSPDGSPDGVLGGSPDGSPDGVLGGSPDGSPDGVLGGVPGGTGTVATGRRAVLDRRLDESFGVFDGMIIAEREKAQTEADAAGSSVMGTGGGADGEGGTGEGSGTFGGAPEGAIVVAGGPQGSTGGGIMPDGGMAREGDYAYNEQPTYPVPEDIPDGDDDDVVARQLREAAMSEADPELREKLWDEYRKYTGLAQ